MHSSALKEPVEILHCSADEFSSHVPDLAEVLFACVEGGAGVGFVLPFSKSDAEAFWRSRLDGMAAGERHTFVALSGGRAVGTVSLELAQQANGGHRADVSKMLVHPECRNRGIARQLLQALDALALSLGRTLLVLDTNTGDVAESLYPKCGYERVGVIPDYALTPEGKLAATTVFFKKLR